MAQNNGLGPNGNAAMYAHAGMNNGAVSVMPSAGHYADMQTLMQHMESLTGWLQQNREDWLQLQDGLGMIEQRTHLAQQNHQPNDDPSPQHQQQHQQQQPTTTQLAAQLAAATTRIAHLEATLTTHATLQTLYEETLSDATERIRQYTFEQQHHVLVLHKHYTTLLAQSRNETIEAQLTHQAWQEHLGRLSGGVRAAMKAREEERRPWLGKVRGLREENRVLRRMVGWEPAGDESEEEEAEAREGSVEGV
ncbi:hypothetical protein B0A50_05279 [Salinomyces thailandicus]|uniref:Uncharacterized protein n=1 Tax=Salinomyces thailandicus TaxID=706561 RepID=A0A4U0TVP7_9PEZI|nr:hypothetical protein B0A50_05279 [Salinomyces thailandica]